MRNMTSIFSPNGYFPSIFDEFIDRPVRNSSVAVNVAENNDEYFIEIAAAGMNKNDLKVSLENENELVISLEKKTDNTAENQVENENKTVYHRHDFTQVSFNKRFILPENIDNDKIAAQMQDGVLKVVLPKKVLVKQEPRQISIC